MTDSAIKACLQQEPELLTLSSGRTLSYTKFGSSSPSHFVFYFHSYPASRVEGALLHDAAVARNIQLICPDRPGMGSSTFVPQRRILDWPEDILALADDLKIPKFACIGTSGGGPFVMACYHKIPRDRLKAAAVVAGLWPTSLGTQGMLLESRAMLLLAPWIPGVVAAGLDYGIGKAARNADDPAAYEAAVAKLMESRPAVDRQMWTENEGGFKGILLANLREALKVDAKGAAHEAKLYGSDWGFALEDVGVQESTLLIWHGKLDKNVPIAMAEKASSLMQGSILETFPEEGHASLLVRKRDDLMARVKEMMA